MYVIRTIDRLGRKQSRKSTVVFPRRDRTQALISHLTSALEIKKETTYPHLNVLHAQNHNDPRSSLLISLIISDRVRGSKREQRKREMKTCSIKFSNTCMLLLFIGLFVQSLFISDQNTYMSKKEWVLSTKTILFLFHPPPPMQRIENIGTRAKHR